MRCSQFLMLIAAFSCFENVSHIEAQQKHSPGDGLAVDVISLKSGKSLRGAIASQQPNGAITIVVSKDWFNVANPTLAEKTLKENLEGQKEAWLQTRDRVAELLKTAIASPHLTFFYKDELIRLEKLIADRNPVEPDFLWIDVRKDAIAKIQRASTDRARIALLAWNERLPHVETRDAQGLLKELTGRGVNLDDPNPAVFDRLPSRVQTAEEWAARLALVEYSIGEPLNFQGMNETLARTRTGQAPNLGEILPKLLQQQLGSLLKDLINEGRPPGQVKGVGEWLASSIRIAEHERARGFKVTRLELDASASQVIVEMRFVAQIADGKWKTIWLRKETGDGTKARPQAEAQIEQDPQLKSAIDTMKSLGLSDGDTLKRAIRIGAATMSTQQAADGAFAEFRDRYIRHLAGPPLQMSTSTVPD
jgi:hypothetical protein